MCQEQSSEMGGLLPVLVVFLVDMGHASQKLGNELLDQRGPQPAACIEVNPAGITATRLSDDHNPLSAFDQGSICTEYNTHTTLRWRIKQLTPVSGL